VRSGPVEIDWDGRDDDGHAVTPGRYSVRVLTHNVRYLWEGVIGNTSSEAKGLHVHRAANPINSMAFDDRGHAFYVVGYNEQQSAIHRFSTADPSRQTALLADDYRRVFRYAATDGALAYFANVGLIAKPGSPLRDSATFVIALNVSDNSEYSFARGRTVSLSPTSPQANHWKSAIDYEYQNLDVDGRFHDAPTGLAVQRRGVALFVAHEGLDEIRVVDKRSGERLDTILVERPTGLAIAPDDSLWVIRRDRGVPMLAHYSAKDGKWVGDRIVGGVQEPLAVGVSPVDGTVVVADGGSEQLRAFNAAGEPVWSFGRSDGYRNGNPEVSTDRLWLSADATYVAFEADGSFWFGDPGNYRNLHLSQKRQYLGQIMYMPKSYHIAVDPRYPTRVFNRFLEFSVDYAKPLKESWRLVRNWGGELEPAYRGDMDGFRQVITLTNGHTYGVIARNGDRLSELVELTQRGLRSTGTKLEFGEKLYPDGSLRSQRQLPQSVEVFRSRLRGFDVQNNPQWKAPQPLAGVALVSSRDPYYHDVPAVAGANEPAFPQTSGDIVVFFNPGRSVGMHLGGVRVGEERWLWRASPSGSWTLDVAGAITSLNGTYELGRGVQYPGSTVTVTGHHIIYGYHGEAWNGGEANQWMHFIDDGLFVGQFGVPVYAAQNRVFAHAGSAGNAFSPELVMVNGEMYLWHNDEGVHSGVHRWHIEGAGTIRTLEAPIMLRP
jgi:hypothetical protein